MYGESVNHCIRSTPRNRTTRNTPGLKHISRSGDNENNNQHDQERAHVNSRCRASQNLASGFGFAEQSAIARFVTENKLRLRVKEAGDLWTEPDGTKYV